MGNSQTRYNFATEREVPVDGLIETWRTKSAWSRFGNCSGRTYRLSLSRAFIFVFPDSGRIGRFRDDSSFRRNRATARLSIDC